MPEPDVTGSIPALARLVGDPERFLADRFGRLPVHLVGESTSAFDDLLSLADVDRIVAATGLRTPSFRLVRDGTTLPRSLVTRSVRIGSRPVDDLIDVQAVHREFTAGATIVLQGLHRSFAPVAELCRSLEVSLTHPVQANAYLTPPGAQGLDVHADPHDVFAVQTHGVKRWVVHAPGEVEPWDLTLGPGDVLYLPAGTRHAAQTLDVASLHLTIGVRTVTVRDVVRRAVDRALADPIFDDPLPAGWADQPSLLTERATGHVRDLAVRIARQDAADDVAAAARGFWSRRTPDLTGGLQDLLALDQLDDVTLLRRRPDASCRVAEDGQVVHLHLGDRSLRLPAAAADALRRITSSDVLVPKDLADVADEDSRLVLCRRLVREGLLTLVRRDPRA
jgi:bifunctional lysine-specific demethylase and histidyl-hydroxylase NO66